MSRWKIKTCIQMHAAAVYNTPEYQRKQPVIIRSVNCWVGVLEILLESFKSHSIPSWKTHL